MKILDLDLDLISRLHEILAQQFRPLHAIKNQTIQSDRF